MSDDRRRTGLDKFNQVYGGTLPTPAEGTMPFFDLMIEQLFAEIWTRPALSLRDRRLLVIGAIVALGERDTFAIQIRSALQNGELSADQCREVVIQLAQYAGYPRVAALAGLVERIVGEVVGS